MVAYDIFCERKNRTEYTYDGKNRLVRKLRNGSQSYRFIYDGSNIAAVVSGGDVQKEYVYGTNINVPDYMNVYLGAPPGRYRLIKDHLGSPRLVVNTDTGEVLQSLDYNEWGRVLRDSNTCFQHFGFAGGIYDDDSRLVKFGARNYDPETGRWTTKDPIRFEGGDTNLYGYVLQDPVNWIDPTGLYEDDPEKTWRENRRDQISDYAEAACENAKEKFKTIKDWFKTNVDEAREAIDNFDGGKSKESEK